MLSKTMQKLADEKTYFSDIAYENATEGISVPIIALEQLKKEKNGLIEKLRKEHTKSIAEINESYELQMRII